MIKYSLQCETLHEFEGWFRNSAEFDEQSEDGLLTCPECGSTAVSKAVMAPSISTSKKAASAKREYQMREMRTAIGEAGAKARSYVEKNFDYVGEKFPEEARKIHYGESEERGIFGEATGKEAKELVDEGVSIAPLPGSATKEKKNLN